MGKLPSAHTDTAARQVHPRLLPKPTQDTLHCIMANHGIADPVFPGERPFASSGLQLVQTYTSQGRKRGLCLRWSGSHAGSPMSGVIRIAGKFTTCLARLRRAANCRDRKRAMEPSSTFCSTQCSSQPPSPERQRHYHDMPCVLPRRAAMTWHAQDARSHCQPQSEDGDSCAICQSTSAGTCTKSCNTRLVLWEHG